MSHKRTPKHLEINDHLIKHEEVLSTEMWDILKKLTSESYDSIDDQIEDILKASKYAESISNMRKTRSFLGRI